MSVSLFFDIFGRDKGAGQMLDEVGGKAEQLDGKLSKVAGGFQKAALPAAAVGTAIFGAAMNFGQMAAAAEQSGGAVETVFGSAASKVEEFASRSAGAVGLSSNEYNELSAVTGTALKAAGVSVDELAGKNDELITRGADLASVFGGTTKEAVEAMGAAFRGEFDPLERYGLTLTANQVSAELAARGQDKLGGAALEAAKKQATMDLIMQQSTSSAGNFAREADTASGAQERQNAKFADAGAKLGEVLLPAMTAAATAAAGMAQWASDNSGLLIVLTGVVGGLAAAVLVINGVMAAHTAISAAVKGATVAWTAVQSALNGVLFANPIGLVVLAIAGLIAAVVLAYNNVGWFKDGVDAAWRGVQGAIGGVVNWFTGTIQPAFNNSLGQIRGFFDDAVRNIGRIWDGLKSAAKAPISFIINTVINDGLIGAFNTVAGWIPGVGKLGRVSIPGFAEGGYTGEGGKYEPKGVVHGGEFVFTKEETSKAGVQTFLKLKRVLQGYADGGFVNPVDGGGTITQGFSGLNGHNGVDIGAPLNTRIMAAFDGNVSWAGWSNMGGGNEIHIKHPGGWETWYAHLNNILVRAGQAVNRAATIGLMGATGNATGSHLHYMLMKGGWPNVVDPTPYMSGKVPAGAINPIAGIIDGLIGGIRGAFGAGGMLTDIVVGVARKLASDMGQAALGGGTGSTMGGLHVFDEGGWMDPGTFGVNRGSRPEAVLDPDESRALKQFLNSGLNLDGYVLELNADLTKATFRRIARGEAVQVVAEVDDDFRRGRTR